MIRSCCWCEPPITYDDLIDFHYELDRAQFPACSAATADRHAMINPEVAS